MILRVIQNILQNSIKFKQEDKPLHISITSETKGSKFIQFNFSDNGIGIKHNKTRH